FSPDGKRLASAADDREVIVWEPETGRLVRKIYCGKEDDDTCWAVAFSPDGNTLAMAVMNRIRLVNLNTGRDRLVFSGHRERVYSLAYSPDGKRLASGGKDGTVRLWYAETGRELITLEGHGYWISAVVFDRRGQLLASSSRDGTVRVWLAREW
ncbi:MAG: WD40 repeat domain-containing protein, partial [Planctomycetota bacterium]